MSQAKNMRQKVAMAEQRSSLEIRQKRKVYAQWKQGEVTWEKYRDVACHCTEKIRASKAQLEFKLAGTVGNNIEFFQLFINGNRKCKNNIRPSLDGNGNLINTGLDKAETFNSFFTPVYNTIDRLKGSQDPEPEDCDCKNYQLPADHEIMWNLLIQLDPAEALKKDLDKLGD